MTQKLLFWTNTFLLHYCLAYFIQEKSDHQLYAIIDSPDKVKPFFQNQKLVNFEKYWFYHDYIEAKKRPDIRYLNNFEKKYGIKLWNLAINERLFYNYNELYKFKKNEILSILESECKLFEKILDDIKPDFYIALNFGLHHEQLMIELCHKKGIKIISLNVSKFPNSCYLTGIDDYFLEKSNSIHDQNFSFDELREMLIDGNLSNKLKTLSDETRKSKLTRFRAGMNVLFSENSNIKTHYSYYGRKKFKIINYELKELIRTKIRENFLLKNSFKEIFDEKFIYFPLNQEPERSLLVEAPFYTNQIETIRHISKSMPIDYILYVKEHPTQGKGRGWRSIKYYKEIMEIPNVKLIHSSVSSVQLIEKSDLVITVNGTASFESLFYETPSIIFVNRGFNDAGVIMLDNLENLSDTINIGLKSKVDLKKLSTYVSSLLKNSFKFDYIAFQLRLNNQFFYNENLHDTHINEIQMEQFLNSEKEYFKFITDKHMDQIKPNELRIK